MATDGCVRCRELVAAVGAGAPLTAAQQGFLTGHLEACSECALAYAPVSVAADAAPLARGGGAEVAEEGSAAPLLGAAAPAEVAAEVAADAPRPPASTRLGLALVAAAALVALGALALLSSIGRDASSSGVIVTAAEGEGASVSEGTAPRVGGALRAGSGRLCLRFDGSGDFCLAPTGSARLEAVGGEEQRLVLERGRAAVALSGRGEAASLVVASPFGDVRAQSAVFSLESREDELVVAVVAGRVEVTGGRQLVEGERLTLPRGQPEPIRRAERGGVAELLAGVAPPVNQPAIPLGREPGALGPERPVPTGSAAAGGVETDAAVTNASGSPSAE